MTDSELVADPQRSAKHRLLAVAQGIAVAKCQAAGERGGSRVQHQAGVLRVRCGEVDVSPFGKVVV